jgi:ketosteroid isomerase-like protein
MDLSEEQARQILFATHDAWNKREFDRLLSFYVDDLIYWVNMGGPEAGPLTIAGKEQLRLRLQAWDPFESLSVPQHFRMAEGVARANIEFFVKDLRSGQSHSSTFRQVATFRDNKISRMEQYHDAPALLAFMAMVRKE